MSSHSPSRSIVADELIDSSLPPFALGTPARERAARLLKNQSAPLQALPWRSPKYTGVDTSPWHRNRIVGVLKEALHPTATIETLLHSAHCFFLSASECLVNRDALRALPALVPLATHLYSRSDNSHSGSRVKEHILNALTMLVGEDSSFDTNVAFDYSWMKEVLPAAVLDTHATVVIAAARHLRRLTEIAEPDDIARQIVLNDDIFNGMLQRYESCEDISVRHHLLCAIVNVTTDPSVHFFLARCLRLVQLLLDEVFAGSAAGTKLAAAQWVKEGAAGASPTAATPSATVVRLRPRLADVSPLHRFMDRSQVTMRQQQRRAEQSQKDGFSVVTGTPRIHYAAGSSAPPASPGARSTAGTTSVGVQGALTPKAAAGGPASGASPAPISPTPRHGPQQQDRRGDEPVSIDVQTAAALTLCELALRVFSNLLSNSAQCAEIRRFAPSLMQAAVDCRSVPVRAVNEAATEVLRRLHDCDREQVDHEVALEVLQGRALAQQLRSKIGGPQQPMDSREVDPSDATDEWFGGDGEGVLHLPDPLGTVTTARSGRASDVPTVYSSRGLGSAVSVVRRALADAGQ